MIWGDKKIRPNLILIEQLIKIETFLITFFEVKFKQTFGKFGFGSRLFGLDLKNKSLRSMYFARICSYVVGYIYDAKFEQDDQR